MNSSKRQVNFIIYAVLFCICVAILFQSPLSPLAKGITGNDSSIFITIGKNILSGDILYKDITDHKGPIIFFINALALKLFNGNLVGIWLFEILSMFVSACFMYKTANLLYDKFISATATIVSLIFLVPILSGGNLTEEWALPFISISMYLFVRYFNNQKGFAVLDLFMISFCFVIAILLKASYGGIWAGFCIITIIRLIKKREFKELTKCTIIVLVSCTLVLSPFVLYFHSHNALNDAWYWMFTFNTKLGDYSIFNTVIFTIQTIIGMRQIPPTIIIVIILLPFINKHFNKYIYSGFLLSIIITAFSCAIGNRFEHYNIIFAPLLIYTFSFLLYNLKLDTPSKKISIIVLLLGGGYIYSMKYLNYWNYNDNYVRRTTSKGDIENVINIIEKHSVPGDLLIADLTDDTMIRSIFVYTNCKCGNKVLSNSSPYNISDEIISKEPKIVIGNSSHTELYRNIHQTVESNYKLVGDSHYYKIWVRNN